MATIFKRGGKKNRHGRYYVDWFDHEGKRRSKCTWTTDKATAERIGAKLEADAALRREGVIDPAQETFSAESRRPLAEHVNAYELKLRASGAAPKHVSETCGAIRTIAEAEGFRQLSDVNAEAVNAYATRLQEANRSARTVGKHIGAIKSFTRWLVETDKLTRDPLASVHKPNPKADRRRERRMMLPEEWDRLRQSIAAEAVDRHGMSPEARTLLYALAIQTGLRSAELRSLTHGRLHLAAVPPFVTAIAGSTKNRKDCRQYVKPELATALGRFAKPGRPVFSMPPETAVAEMLRADLAPAGIAAVDSDGRRLDFHALRHTCGAWLAMAGAHPNAVKAVMRHSTIVLTMDAYGHLFPGQEADTIAKLPDMLTDTACLTAVGARSDADETPPRATTCDKSKKENRTKPR